MLHCSIQNRLQDRTSKVNDAAGTSSTAVVLCGTE